MANFYQEDKFTLKQDWNCSKIIYKSDDWIHQQAYDSAYEHMMEYLEIGSEDELTEVHLDECHALIDYLETPYSEGGAGYGGTDSHSETYYAYYRVMMDWIENFEIEHEGAPIA